MPKGSQAIPALQLETLNRLITNVPRPPATFFSNMFPTTQYESDQIRWEIEYSSAGMTPFVAPGSVAPAIGLDGVGDASARAAYWKEKMYFDEVFLNNLREPGSWATYQTAERKLARGSAKLKNRIDRRREWMVAKMLLDGTLSYTMTGGTSISVSYGVPTSHQVSLPAAAGWCQADGTPNTSANPIADIFDAKRTLIDDAGVNPNLAICNSFLLKALMINSTLQGLLEKSAFGNGDLFQNPAAVIGTLLGVGTLTVYDELYDVTGWIVGTVTGGATTAIPVDDTSDFEVGGTLRFVDMSEYNTYEDRTISAVDHSAGTVTVSAAPTNSYLAGEDKVIMRKKFIDDGTFFLMSDTNGNGEKIAEFMEAPYGMDRRWGMFADTKDEWDPEGMWLRVQDKGLPVLYFPDTTYKMTVKD